MRRLPARNAAGKPPAATLMPAAPSPNVAIPNAPNPAAGVLSLNALQMRGVERTCHGPQAHAKTTPAALKDRVTNLPAVSKARGMLAARTMTITRVANAPMARSAPINIVRKRRNTSTKAHEAPKCTAPKAHEPANTASAVLAVKSTPSAAPIIAKVLRHP